MSDNMATMLLLSGKLYKERLTICEYRIILCIVKHTICINKEYVQISHGYIAHETQTDESTTKKSIKALEKIGILKNYKKPGELFNLWGINPDYIYNFSYSMAKAEAENGTDAAHAEPGTETTEPRTEPMQKANLGRGSGAENGTDAAQKKKIKANVKKHEQKKKNNI